MTDAPQNVALATAFVGRPADQIWPSIADLKLWPKVFPAWIAKISEDDDHFTATGVGGEVFALYPQLAEDHCVLDVERLDELGSADVLRLRAIDVRGGCFVTAAHSRLPGIPDPEWARVSAAISAGLDGLGDDL